MPPTPNKERVQRYRNGLRQAGLRPVQIWIPDTRGLGFAEECRRQSQLVAEADAADRDLQPLLEDAVGGLEGWTP